jgi:hypothetical protein
MYRVAKLRLIASYYCTPNTRPGGHLLERIHEWCVCRMAGCRHGVDQATAASCEVLRCIARNAGLSDGTVLPRVGRTCRSRASRGRGRDARHLSEPGYLRKPARLETCSRIVIAMTSFGVSSASKTSRGARPSPFRSRPSRVYGRFPEGPNRSVLIRSGLWPKALRRSATCSTNDVGPQT